ncbi:hypothetical protein H4219_003594 [Mycoemilia scoparia]|uniref:DH domain-containing protein n=1 Tax=Mycoemilia scoparia TaxID=417184 RepID=A0A9W7ZZR7_9FUNG|nr:hypothetical protein H4219_003594 [Mycoemilia scoparia]
MHEATTSTTEQHSTSSNPADVGGGLALNDSNLPSNNSPASPLNLEPTKSEDKTTNNPDSSNDSESDGDADEAVIKSLRLHRIRTRKLSKRQKSKEQQNQENSDDADRKRKEKFRQSLARGPSYVLRKALDGINQEELGTLSDEGTVSPTSLFNRSASSSFTEHHNQNYNRYNRLGRRQASLTDLSSLSGISSRKSSIRRNKKQRDAPSRNKSRGDTEYGSFSETGEEEEEAISDPELTMCKAVATEKPALRALSGLFDPIGDADDDNSDIDEDQDEFYNLGRTKTWKIRSEKLIQRQRRNTIRRYKGSIRGVGGRENQSIPMPTTPLPAIPLHIRTAAALDKKAAAAAAANNSTNKDNNDDSANNNSDRSCSRNTDSNRVQDTQQQSQANKEEAAAAELGSPIDTNAVIRNADTEQQPSISKIEEPANETYENVNDNSSKRGNNTNNQPVLTETGAYSATINTGNISIANSDTPLARNNDTLVENVKGGGQCTETTIATNTASGVVGVAADPGTNISVDIDYTADPSADSTAQLQLSKEKEVNKQSSSPSPMMVIEGDDEAALSDNKASSTEHVIAPSTTEKHVDGPVKQTSSKVAPAAVAATTTTTTATKSPDPVEGSEQRPTGIAKKRPPRPSASFLLTDESSPPTPVTETEPQTPVVDKKGPAVAYDGDDNVKTTLGHETNTNPKPELSKVLPVDDSVGGKKVVDSTTADQNESQDDNDDSNVDAGLQQGDVDEDHDANVSTPMPTSTFTEHHVELSPKSVDSESRQDLQLTSPVQSTKDIQTQDKENIEPHSNSNVDEESDEEIPLSKLPKKSVEKSVEPLEAASENLSTGSSINSGQVPKVPSTGHIVKAYSKGKDVEKDSTKVESVTSTSGNRDLNVRVSTDANVADQYVFIETKTPTSDGTVKKSSQKVPPPLPTTARPSLPIDTNYHLIDKPKSVLTELPSPTKDDGGLTELEKWLQRHNHTLPELKIPYPVVNPSYLPKIKTRRLGPSPVLMTTSYNPQVAKTSLALTTSFALSQTRLNQPGTPKTPGTPKAMSPSSSRLVINTNVKDMPAVVSKPTEIQQPSPPKSPAMEASEILRKSLDSQERELGAAISPTSPTISTTAASPIIQRRSRRESFKDSAASALSTLPRRMSAVISSVTGSSSGIKDGSSSYSTTDISSSSGHGGITAAATTTNDESLAGVTNTTFSGQNDEQKSSGGTGSRRQSNASRVSSSVDSRGSGDVKRNLERQSTSSTQYATKASTPTASIPPSTAGEIIRKPQRLPSDIQKHGPNSIGKGKEKSPSFDNTTNTPTVATAAVYGKNASVFNGASMVHNILSPSSPKPAQVVEAKTKVPQQISPVASSENRSTDTITVASGQKKAAAIPENKFGHKTGRISDVTTKSSTLSTEEDIPADLDNDKEEQAMLDSIRRNVTSMRKPLDTDTTSIAADSDNKGQGYIVNDELRNPISIVPSREDSKLEEKSKSNKLRRTDKRESVNSRYINDDDDNVSSSPVTNPAAIRKPAQLRGMHSIPLAPSTKAVLESYSSMSSSGGDDESHYVSAMSTTSSKGLADDLPQSAISRASNNSTGNSHTDSVERMTSSSQEVPLSVSDGGGLTRQSTQSSTSEYSTSYRLSSMYPQPPPTSQPASYEADPYSQPELVYIDPRQPGINDHVIHNVGPRPSAHGHGNLARGQNNSSLQRAHMQQQQQQRLPSLQHQQPLQTPPPPYSPTPEYPLSPKYQELDDQYHQQQQVSPPQQHLPRPPADLRDRSPQMGGNNSSSSPVMEQQRHRRQASPATTSAGPPGVPDYHHHSRPPPSPQHRSDHHPRHNYQSYGGSGRPSGDFSPRPYPAYDMHPPPPRPHHHQQQQQLPNMVQEDAHSQSQSPEQPAAVESLPDVSSQDLPPGLARALQRRKQNLQAGSQAMPQRRPPPQHHNPHHRSQHHHYQHPRPHPQQQHYAHYNPGGEQDSPSPRPTAVAGRNSAGGPTVVTAQYLTTPMINAISNNQQQQATYFGENGNEVIKSVKSTGDLRKENTINATGRNNQNLMSPSSTIRSSRGHHGTSGSDHEYYENKRVNELRHSMSIAGYDEGSGVSSSSSSLRNQHRASNKANRASWSNPLLVVNNDGQSLLSSASSVKTINTSSNTTSSLSSDSISASNSTVIASNANYPHQHKQSQQPKILETKEEFEDYKMKYKIAIEELVQTEESFVRDLGLLIELFYRPIERISLTQQQQRQIASNIISIDEINNHHTAAGFDTTTPGGDGSSDVKRPRNITGNYTVDTLFGNILEIRKLAKAFLKDLRVAVFQTQSRVDNITFENGNPNSINHDNEEDRKNKSLGGGEGGVQEEKYDDDDDDDDDDDSWNIPKVMLKHLDKFCEPYAYYAANHIRSIQFLTDLRKMVNSKTIMANRITPEQVKAWEIIQTGEADKRSRRLTFESFLVVPVQRIMRYPLLLNAIQKYASAIDYTILINQYRQQKQEKQLLWSPSSLDAIDEKLDNNNNDDEKNVIREFKDTPEMVDQKLATIPMELSLSTVSNQSPCNPHTIKTALELSERVSEIVNQKSNELNNRRKLIELQNRIDWFNLLGVELHLCSFTRLLGMRRYIREGPMLNKVATAGSLISGRKRIYAFLMNDLLFLTLQWREGHRWLYELYRAPIQTCDIVVRVPSMDQSHRRRSSSISGTNNQEGGSNVGPTTSIEDVSKPLDIHSFEIVHTRTRESIVLKTQDASKWVKDLIKVSENHYQALQDAINAGTVVVDGGSKSQKRIILSQTDRDRIRKGHKPKHLNRKH